MTAPKSAQQGQTMTEGLQKMLGELAQMQALPDADVDFLSQLQQVIVGKVRSTMQGQQPGQQLGQAGAQNSPGAPGQMQQAGPGQPPGQASPSPMGGPAMGLSATGNVGNMDELARVLGGASQTG